jgi:endonuclease V-like protein UPF0215 family
MRAQTDDIDLTDSITEMVKKSPHSQQIRVLLLHDELLGEGVQVDLLRVSERIKKPIIVMHTQEYPLRDEHPSQGIEEAKIRLGGRDVSASLLGVAPKVAERVMQAVTREGTMPEALRVARIIASAVEEASCISFKSDSKC